MQLPCGHSMCLKCCAGSLDSPGPPHDTGRMAMCSPPAARHPTTKESALAVAWSVLLWPARWTLAPSTPTADWTFGSLLLDASTERTQCVRLPRPVACAECMSVCNQTRASLNMALLTWMRCCTLGTLLCGTPSGDDQHPSCGNCGQAFSMHRFPVQPLPMAIRRADADPLFHSDPRVYEQHEHTCRDAHFICSTCRVDPRLDQRHCHACRKANTPVLPRIVVSDAQQRPMLPCCRWCSVAFSHSAHHPERHPFRRATTKECLCQRCVHHQAPSVQSEWRPHLSLMRALAQWEWLCPCTKSIEASVAREACPLTWSELALVGTDNAEAVCSCGVACIEHVSGHSAPAHANAHAGTNKATNA